MGASSVGNLFGSDQHQITLARFSPPRLGGFKGRVNKSPQVKWIKKGHLESKWYIVRLTMKYAQIKLNITKRPKITLTSRVKNMSLNFTTWNKNRSRESVCFEMFRKRCLKTPGSELRCVRSDYRKESHPGERRGDRKRNKRDGTLARFALVSNWGTLKWRGGSIEDKV